MDILLCHTPFIDLRSPPLGTACLAAYLRSKGLSAAQLDLNLEICRELFSRENIAASRATVEEMLLRSPLEPDLERVLRTALLIAEEVNLNSSAGAPMPHLEKSASNRDIMASMRGMSHLVSAPAWPEAKFHFVRNEYVTPGYDTSRLSEIMRYAQQPPNDLFSSWTRDYGLKRVLDYNPSMVGLSISSEMQPQSSLLLARLIKERVPGMPVVWGGGAVPYMVPALRSCPQFFDMVDYVVVGEGEEPLLQLARAHQEGISASRLSDIPNLIWRAPGGNVVVNPGVWQADMDDLPCPDLNEHDMDRYYCNRRWLPYLASRGCYWNRCVFCSLTSNYGHAYRERSMDNVASDIDILIRKHGADRIVFNDECISPQRLHMLSEILKG